jgi:HK97 family phage portal protein
MPLFDFLSRKATPQPEERTAVSTTSALSKYFGLTGRTKSGASITTETSLAVSSVYASVNRIASTIASLDIHVYKTSGESRKVTKHPVSTLVAHQADSKTTAFEFWESIVSDSLLWGNGFAYIEKAGPTPSALVHLPASQVQKVEERGNIYYNLVSTDPKTRRLTVARRFSPEELVIIPAFRGLSPIALHRESIGLAKSAKDFGASFFGSGGNVSGVLMTDKTLTDEQYTALQNGWHQKYHGSDAAHATAILEHGLKYERVGIPPDQAQFIETQKLSNEDVARIFGVPGSLIGLETNTTYNNMEQLNIMFAQYTVQPLVKRIENELNTKLFTKREQSNTSVEFDLATLLRGDAATRSDYFSTLIRDGVMSINEVRQVEGLNPVDGGDVHLVNTNLLPLSMIQSYGEKLAAPAPEPEPTSEDTTENGDDQTDNGEPVDDSNENTEDVQS